MKHDNTVNAVILSSLALTMGCTQQNKDVAETKTREPFKGTIKLDVRESVADWTPFVPKKAPEGAPNILFVLYDDTGLASWSPYGGRINMPTLDRLAANGLIY